MKTWFLALALALALVACGSSENPTSTSTGSASASSGGPQRGDAGECDYPLTGGLDLTISSPSDNCNAETRHLAVDPAPMVGTYGTDVCTKGCTVITGGCVLGQSKQKTLASIQVAFAGKPVSGKTYTIIPAKTGSDENGNPGLPTDGGYVAFFEGPKGLMPSRFWIATQGTLKIDDVQGATVKFSFTGMAMNQDAVEKSESQGTFTMDGSGMAKLPIVP